MRKLEEMEWWPELLSIKDQFSLRELAERFEVSGQQIKAALLRNGIDREPGVRPRREPIKPPSVAEQLQPFADMIGKVPDDEIAGLAGVTPKQVAAFRTKAGIPAAAENVRPAKTHKQPKETPNE